MITINVTGNAAKAESLEMLTTGTVGAKIKFNFGPEWDGLVRWACFRNDYGDPLPTVAIREASGNIVAVPPEVLRRPGSMPRVGVFGSNEEGTIVTPTIHAPISAGPLCLGAERSGIPPEPPTPDWVSGIETDVDKALTDSGKALETAQDVERRANEGEFNGKDGDPGKSAYQVAVDNGFKGTEAEWLESLVGESYNAFAVCYDPPAPSSFAANKWYIPKTMPKPTAEVGLMVDVLWKQGRVSGLGYDVQLIWGAPDGADNEIIVDTASTADHLTGDHSIPVEGTVRYQLTEYSGRMRWDYVSGELISTQFSSGTASAVAEKLVPGMSLEYIPGMEIYVQLDRGNTAELMSLKDDNGLSLPVYGNGTGAKTGNIPAGYILHLVNAGDHWQIINSGGGGAVDSVNGKTGTVVLTAADVQARADTWTPTAADVGALPDDTPIPNVPSWALQPNKPSYSAADVGALPNTTKIPAKLSELTSDAGHQTVTAAQKGAWNAKSDFSGSYNDLADKPTIPPAYTLPIAGAELGGVKGPAPTAEQTETAGIDEYGNIKYKAGGSSVDEGTYKLIEKITFDVAAPLEKTAWPDGKPYNFKAVTVKIKLGPKVEPYSAGVLICGRGFPDFLNFGEMYFSNNYFPDMYNVGEWIAEFGYWKHTERDWAKNNLESKTLSGGFWCDVLAYPAETNINKVGTISNLPAGTYLEIWGVEA